LLRKAGADPSIASCNASAVKIYNASAVKIYNASAVKIYNATSSLVRLANENIFFYLEKSSSLLPATLASKIVGLAPGVKRGKNRTGLIRATNFVLRKKRPCRVARFFLVRDTKTGKKCINSTQNVPNGQ
jgi:hypothetical protein